MPWWIPLVLPTATFMHSHLPPLPGSAPVAEIEDEEYVLVDHDPYVGTVDKEEKKPLTKSTDEVLEKERHREEQMKEDRGRESGIDAGTAGKRRGNTERTEDERRVAGLMNKIDREIVEAEGDDKFNWVWFSAADTRNRDTYIYHKRRLLLETKLKSAAEAKHFLPLVAILRKLTSS